MQRTRAVQVVLGEGEPGILRSILEAQGFDVVGHARGDDELRRIVPLTRPTVMVFDAGISGLAVIDAQIRSDYVPIVVVWPAGTYTSAAEERVDPSSALLELGNAVRRVVERHAGPIRVPEAEDDESIIEPTPAPSLPEHRRGAGRGRHVLVVIAAWTIALTALAAIGLAVPRVFRAPEPTGTLHPLRDRPERALTADREGPGRRSADVEREPCDRPAHERMGPHPVHRDADGPGRGCALGHGKHEPPGTRGQGHGRPDDPGKGTGHGNEERGGPSNDETSKGDETNHGGGYGGDPSQDDHPAGHGDGGGSKGSGKD